MSHQARQRRADSSGSAGSAPVGPVSRPKSGRNSRLSSGLVALGIAASLSVYAVGYTRTQAAVVAGGGYGSTLPARASVQAAPVQPTAPPAITATATLLPSPATSAVLRTPPSSTSAAVSPRPTTAVPPAPAATWRDGTYNGLGNSRHGSIGVAVVIQGGKIAAVTITDCGTRYPCGLIAALPGEVVARQSAAVDVVSGATDSSTAFRGAITSALSQARAGA